MEIEQSYTTTRRGLTTGVVTLGGAALLSTALPAAARTQAHTLAQGSPFKDDLDILNFALALEFFEVELYSVLAGSGKLQGSDLQHIQMFGRNEQAHVDALLATIQRLGGTPVQKGAYNIPTLNTRDEVLNLLATVEQTGSSGYQGAVPFIQNKEVLAAAGSILTVEARHAALLRNMLGIAPSPDAFTRPLSKDEVLAAVAPFFNQ